MRIDHFSQMVFMVAALFPRSAMAQGVGPAVQQPQWWQVVAGILAIPAAVLGIAYSYILIRKTRLEARKTELEIAEKERALTTLGPRQGKVAREIVRPIIEGRHAQLLVLRFALLYVVLRLWGLVESALGFFAGGAFLGLQKVVGFDLENSWILFPAYALSKLPEVVRWIIVIGIGWPLFRDLNRFLHLDLKRILMPWRK